MRAGELRRRVTFQSRSTVRDTFGGQSTTWTDALANVPVKFEELSGRELLAAQAVRAEITHRITARYHPALASPVAVAAMRAVYNGRYFNLYAPMNVEERNLEITILASEGLNNG